MTVIGGLTPCRSPWGESLGDFLFFCEGGFSMVTLKVNGQDMGRIKGSFSFSREAVAEQIDDNGIAYVPGAAEIRIDTDAMMTLADSAGDSKEALSAQLKFAGRMVRYLQSSLSQYGRHPHRPDVVPSRIRVIKDVRSDVPFDQSVAPAGVYDCESNQWGACSVAATDGMQIGVKPSELEILEFVPNPHLEQCVKAQ